jgi:hypothetical protein
MRCRRSPRLRRPLHPAPQRPASPATTGASRADKVEGKAAPLTHAVQSAKVLQALRASGEPLSQKELLQKNGIKVWTLREVLSDLVGAKTVRRTGNGRGQRFHLAT